MIQFDHVSKSYGETKVLNDLSLTIEKGQLVVLIGPSGCGKTTSLQLINRLTLPTAGRILVDGKDIATVDPVELRRGIGYVIQEIGLFPHMTIAQNIEVVPRLLGWPEAKRQSRTRELFQMVDMDPDVYMNRYPSHLSGGQQQRIGVLRALAAEPDIILMDEPFGALDPITRDSLQDEIKALQKKLKKTIVFVTHDIGEALKLADIIVIMKDGVVVQAAAPEELLSNPADEFVENFIGKHRIIGGTVDKVNEVMRTEIAVITPDRGVSESIDLMQRKNVNTVIVVDDDRKFLGLVTIDKIKREGRPGRPVGELMDKDIPTVPPDASAMDAFDLLVNQRLDVVAVVEPSGRLIGVVTKTSMVRSLAHVVWRGAENG